MSQATTLTSEMGWADSFGDEPDYEVIDGRRVELPPMGVREGFIANEVVFQLAQFARSHELGHALGETLFKLLPDQNRKRRPDAAFVSFDRWAKDRPIPDSAAWEVVPDLAVEVVSPTDPAIDLIDRVEEYLKAGVRRIWVVYPGAGVVHVYDPPGSIAIRRRGDDLDGGDVLPGFRLGVAELLKVMGVGPDETPKDAG